MAISRVTNTEELLYPAGASSINLWVTITTWVKWSGELVAILFSTVSLWWGILRENYNFCQCIGSSSSKVANIEKRHWELFIYLFINKFVYFWLRWVFVAMRGVSLVAESGGYSSLRCAGCSLRWLLLLQSTGSRHEGFSSCGARA